MVMNPMVQFVKNHPPQKKTKNMENFQSKISPTGPTERNPNPEYLKSSNNLLRGSLVSSYSTFDGFNENVLVLSLLSTPIYIYSYIQQVHFIV